MSNPQAHSPEFHNFPADTGPVYRPPQTGPESTRQPRIPQSPEVSQHALNELARRNERETIAKLNQLLADTASEALPIGMDIVRLRGDEPDPVVHFGRNEADQHARLEQELSR